MCTRSSPTKDRMLSCRYKFPRGFNDKCLAAPPFPPPHPTTRSPNRGNTFVFWEGNIFKQMELLKLGTHRQLSVRWNCTRRNLRIRGWPRVDQHGEDKATTIATKLSTTSHRPTYYAHIPHYRTTILCIGVRFGKLITFGRFPFVFLFCGIVPLHGIS